MKVFYKIKKPKQWKKQNGKTITIFANNIKSRVDAGYNETDILKNDLTHFIKLKFVSYENCRNANTNNAKW